MTESDLATFELLLPGSRDCQDERTTTLPEIRRAKRRDAGCLLYINHFSEVSQVGVKHVPGM